MAGEDYSFLLNNKPQGFIFKPACGKMCGDGSVTVSGMNMTEREIDGYGIKHADLIDIFEEIDRKVEEVKKENSQKNKKNQNR